MLTFCGYERPNGRPAVRNLCLVLPTSELCNRAAELVEQFEPRSVSVRHYNASPGGDRDFHVDVLAGFCTNPNVGHVLLAAMGDPGDIGSDLAARVAAAGTPCDLFTLISAGSVPKLAEQIAARASEVCLALDAVPRRSVPVSELLLGTECGGSDAYSGLTANPALGVASDLLIAQGGTSILAEMPELIGAEHLVAARASDDRVARDVVAAVRAWEKMVMDFGQDLRRAQPSPGNMDGGLTTIEEKSLGAAHKAGSGRVIEVVGFGRRPTRRGGVVVMDTPGHDVEQLTGMAAGGAQVIVFTTGRGTPTSSPIAPTIKVSTNSRTAQRLAGHIDIDAGPIALGRSSKELVGRQIFDEILAVAGGKPTAAERWGQRDFALPRTAPSTQWR